MYERVHSWTRKMLPAVVSCLSSFDLKYFDTLLPVVLFTWHKGMTSPKECYHEGDLQISGSFAKDSQSHLSSWADVDPELADIIHDFARSIVPRRATGVVGRQFVFVSKATLYVCRQQRSILLHDKKGVRSNTSSNVCNYFVCISTRDQLLI